MVDDINADLGDTEFVLGNSIRQHWIPGQKADRNLAPLFKLKEADLSQPKPEASPPAPVDKQDAKNQAPTQPSQGGTKDSADKQVTPKAPTATEPSAIAAAVER